MSKSASTQLRAALEQLVQPSDLRPCNIRHDEIKQGLVIDEQYALGPVYVNQVGMPGSETGEARFLGAQIGLLQPHFLLELFCAANQRHFSPVFRRYRKSFTVIENHIKNVGHVENPQTQQPFTYPYRA
jgi:hypothetical protein